ncbi:MAG TPA: CHAT domain-containing tetratricopeptide repeat protein [Candidatus Obscuribacterales bacterium]
MARSHWSLGLSVLLAGWGSLLILPPSLARPADVATPLATQARQLFDLGGRQYNNRQFTEAIATWEQALALYRQLGDRRQEAYLLTNLGSAYENLYQTDTALTFYQESLALAEEIQDSSGQSYALGNLGYLYERNGDYEQALIYLRRGLPLAQSRGDRADEAYLLNQIGIVLKAQGLMDEAIAEFEASLAIAEEIGDLSLQANSQGNLGNTYLETGRYPQALDRYGVTLTLMRQQGNLQGEAIVLQRLGNLYLDLGNPERAVDYYQQTEVIAQQLGDPRLQAYNQGNLALAYRHLGQMDRALPELQLALDQLQTLGDRPRLATGFNSLGNIYADLQENDQAIQAYQQSLELSQALGDRHGQVMALGNLGQMAEQLGQYTQALSYYEQSLQLAVETGDLRRQGLALDYLGAFYFNQADYEQSVVYLKDAVEVWESMRPGLQDEDQVSLFETQVSTYQLLQRALIRLNRYDDALEMSERGRARTFIELVANRQSPAIAASLQVPPPSLSDIQAIARQQQATIIQYSILSSAELAIWVVQPTGDIQFQLVQFNSSDLSLDTAVEETRVAAALGRGNQDPQWTSLVQQTRSGILESADLPESALSRQPVESPPPSSTALSRRQNPQLQSFYRLLIDPIASFLPDDPASHVIIVPHDALFLLPFAALQDEDGRYLIERHTVTTAPSIQVLALTQSRPISPTSLIVGNPQMPSVGQPPLPLSPLPNAEQEAIEIAAFLDADPLLGAEATEARVVQQMGGAQVIHLATHGLLDDLGEVGLPGAIALAPSSTDNGLLTAGEILELRLSADLVVLSACDTGRGRITGDGVLGLSRSFMAAGANSVLVSLWAVPDDSTTLLMTEFYRHLAETPDSAQALRQAMLTTMETYPSSRDWAAFTLMGQSSISQP